MNRLATYLRESRAELARVNWPDRPTTIRLTIAVIVFSAIVTALIGGLDYVFSQILQRIILKG